MGRIKKSAEIDTAIAAYLFATSEQPDRLQSQMEIAKRMGISEVALSRLLKRAREARLLKMSFIEQPGLGETEVLAELNRRQYSSVYQGAIRGYADRYHPGRLQGVHIFDTPSRSDSVNREGWEETIEVLGQVSAGLTREFLLRSDSVAVAWGRTLHCVVAGLERLGGTGWRTNEPLEVFPLWGEFFTKPPKRPSRFTYPMLSSTRLAERLAHLLNGDPASALSLAGVPALINRRHSGAALRAIMDSLQDNDDYRTIFTGDKARRSDRQGPPSSLADRMETALVAVGSAADSTELFWNPVMAKHADFDVELLKEAACGDIGGVLIPKESTAPVSKQALRHWSQAKAHWTGVRIEHLTACAERASAKNLPGVVVYAAGIVRCEVIAAVLRLGLVNRLVIDTKLGEALANRLRPNSNKRSSARDVGGVHGQSDTSAAGRG